MSTRSWLFVPALTALTLPALGFQEIDETWTSAEGEAPIVRETWTHPTPIASGGGVPEAFLGGTVSFLSTNVAPENDMPRDLAFTPDGSAVVVVGRDTDVVSFLDVATRTVTHTVPVGDFPVDVAVTPDGTYAVVCNALGDSVTVVDIASHTVAATIPVTGTQPYRVEITSDSAFAVVGVINDGISSAVSVIDLGSLTESSSFATAPQGVIGFFLTPESGIFGNLFTQFALSPNDVTLVLPDRGNDQVVLYDITTGLPTATLATAAGPTAVDVSSNGLVAVVSHEGSAQTVTEIGLIGQAVTGSFNVGVNLVNQVIRITPDRTHAICAISNNVIFVNLTTGAVTSTLSTGTVGDIEISFDGQYAFVSNFNSRVIHIATQSQVASLSLAPTYDAAASPVAHGVVALNNRFREDVHFYATNGGASSVLGRTLSGAPPEADATRALAVTNDGQVAVAANNTSRSASVIDLATGTVRATPDAGDRALDVAITPDGSTAVITGGDDDTVSVIDLNTDTRVANLALSGRPARVVVSPDGQHAYVTTIAGADAVHKLALNGAASSFVGSLVTGQMGSVIYTYTVLSDVTVSPDGSLLALCISFDDELLLVDTATMTEVARVAVGDFPIQARFSPDGTRLYVSNSFSDDVYELNVNGAATAVTAVVGGVDFPLTLEVAADGAHVYVGAFSGTPAIHVIDTATDTIVATLPTPSSPRAAHLSNVDCKLYVSTTGGEMLRIAAEGAASVIESSEFLSAGASDMVFSESLRTAVAAQPGAADGVDLVTYPTSEVYCTSLANSSGSAAQLSTTGSLSVTANDLGLVCTQMPAQQSGLFIYSPDKTEVPLGNGTLCLGNQTLGFVLRLPPGSSSAGGVLTHALDNTSPPATEGLITPGSTWNFQCWFRDVPAGGAGFNFSDARHLTFGP